MATNQNPPANPDPQPDQDPGQSPDPAPAPPHPLIGLWRSKYRWWVIGGLVALAAVGYQYCSTSNEPAYIPPEPTPAATPTPAPVAVLRAEGDGTVTIPDNWHCVEPRDYCFYEFFEEVDSCYRQGFGQDGQARPRQDILEYTLAATPNAAAELLAMLEVGCDEKVAGHWQLPGRTRLLSWLAGYASVDANADAGTE